MLVLGSHLRRCLIAQGTVGALGIVRLPPLFNHHGGFVARPEPFAIEAFISELAVKTLDVAVLPGMPWLNKAGPDPLSLEPTHDRRRGELTAIIRANELRRALLIHGRRQGRDD